MCFFNGNDADGLRAFEESLELHRDRGNRAGETRALVGVCQVLVAQGDVERTEQLSQELLELARKDEDLRSEHFAQHYLADCSLIRADYDRAAERYRESLRTVLRLGDLLETGFEVQGGRNGRFWTGRPRAGGHARRRRRGALGGARHQYFRHFWDALLEKHIGDARRQLGAEGAGHWSHGRSLTFDEAISLALE